MCWLYLDRLRFLLMVKLTYTPPNYLVTVFDMKKSAQYIVARCRHVV